MSFEPVIFHTMFQILLTFHCVRSMYTVHIVLSQHFNEFAVCLHGFPGLLTIVSSDICSPMNFVVAGHALPHQF